MENDLRPSLLKAFQQLSETLADREDPRPHVEALERLQRLLGAGDLDLEARVTSLENELKTVSRMLEAQKLIRRADAAYRTS